MKNQIHLYSLDEKAFYTDKENQILEIKWWVYRQIETLKEFILFNLLGLQDYQFKDFSDFSDQKDKSITLEKYLKTMTKDNETALKSDVYTASLNSNETYLTSRNEIKIIKNALESEFKNSPCRELNPNSLTPYRKISLFESAFSRYLHIGTDEITTDVFIVKVTHYEIMNQLINNGFTFWGEKYIYFTSSAGQIRNKKLVFIKESAYKKYSRTIMCGLSVDKINDSNEHGCNINKYLAYLALNNSATDEWKDFDIDKAIVIDDFETPVEGKVDYIDNVSFEVTPQEMLVPITHSDGCGWILPSESKHNFMVRLPWVKGLLTSVDFLKYCDEHNDGNYKIKDIYGKTWDLKADDIRIVFSKSQFKMYKYYPNILNDDGSIKQYGWDTYKANFKKYGCQASKCNEETKFKDARFNYQMLQTLTDMTDEEIDAFIKPSKDMIQRSYTDINAMLEILGATSNNPNKNYLQQALEIYPELLKDEHVKKELSDIINARKKEAKSGKVKIDAKYTFILPDVFAWMEYSIGGKTNPIGLLDNGEVFCKLYKGKKELLVDRSPHLYLEHAVRNNVIDREKGKWFTTNGIYTSCHDLISKTLQFDVDGDKSLVVGDSNIIEIAKRNMQNVLPLYYEMGKAKAKEITTGNICESQKIAFKYGNIGEYSNLLTKLWNVEESERDLNVCKVICALNNFSIDAAKTLTFPKLPLEVDKKVKEVDNMIDLPYFFQFAKDYNAEKLAKRNDSTVNRICAKIEDIGIRDYDFSGIGNFRSATLMHDKKIVVKDEVIAKYDELNEVKDKWFAQKKLPKEEIASAIYSTIKAELLAAFPELSIEEIVDMIIKHIYKTQRKSRKTFLFKCFGDIIVENLKRNINKPLDGDNIICSCCGKRAKKTSNRQTMCKKCSEAKIKEKDRQRKRIHISKS